ncbi:MAG: hypothetical protein ACI4LC_07625 [Emergencia sp.]
MKRVHDSSCTCSICESGHYEAIAFKAGYVCESCLEYVRSHQTHQKGDEIKAEDRPADRL